MCLQLVILLQYCLSDGCRGRMGFVILCKMITLQKTIFENIDIVKRAYKYNFNICLH